MGILANWFKKPLTNRVHEKYLIARIHYGHKISQMKQDHIKCKIRTRLNLEYGIKRTRHRRIAPTRTVMPIWFRRDV